ncbi:hypothetical protein MCEMSEM23_01296 [Rhabdaerophilaceae bacterium]
MFAVLWDMVATGLSWIGLAYAIAVAAVFAFGIGFVIWNDSIKPRLIPREDIARLASDIAARHPDDPEHAAYSELEAAWWRSDGAEQVKWKRVLKEIRRRAASTKAIG